MRGAGNMHSIWKQSNNVTIHFGTQNKDIKIIFLYIDISIFK